MYYHIGQIVFTLIVLIVIFIVIVFVFTRSSASADLHPCDDSDQNDSDVDVCNVALSATGATGSSFTSPPQLLLSAQAVDANTGATGSSGAIGQLGLPGQTGDAGSAASGPGIVGADGGLSGLGAGGSIGNMQNGAGTGFTGAAGLAVTGASGATGGRGASGPTSNPGTTGPTTSRTIEFSVGYMVTPYPIGVPGGGGVPALAIGFGLAGTAFNYPPVAINDACNTFSSAFGSNGVITNLRASLSCAGIDPGSTLTLGVYISTPTVGTPAFNFNPVPVLSSTVPLVIADNSARYHYFSSTTQVGAVLSDQRYVILITVTAVGNNTIDVYSASGAFDYSIPPV